MPGRNILVCVAWPYANGSLHLGHLAGSLLPPDIFARYHRAAGNQVLMVSGSDCHGTPITVTAEKMGLTPAQVVDKYHAEHRETLRQLGIQFDLFTKTTTKNHEELVHDIFLTHRDLGYLYEKQTQGMYCPKDQRFLPDRYVEGTCPHCQNPQARGDQCDKCGKTLDPVDLAEPKCKLCGTRPEMKPTSHFFFKLSAFEGKLKAWLKDKKDWRANTINFTNNWLAEGLKDRAITRDLQWGIRIPIEGYDGKRIYVWYEAVCGYFTASVEWAQSQGRPDAWKDWWLNSEARSYYFLGKDNIPFHTIIWPAMLMGYSEGLRKKGKIPRDLALPYDVPANEFLTLSGQQFSKSRGIGITLPDVLGRFEPDTVRYYLSANMPEQKDADWSWDDFVAKINDELVGTFGNFVHRTVSFTYQHFKEIPAAGPLDARDREVLARADRALKTAAEYLERCEFKKALREAMALAQAANQYIDAKAPWTLIKTDRAACATALHVSLRLVKCLCVLLQPFLPFAAQKMWRQLNEAGDIAATPWSTATAPLQAGTKLAVPHILFKKIEPEQVGAKPMEPKPSAATQAHDVVTFEQFQKLDLRVGQIVGVEDHPKADKLYVLKVDIGNGEVRQLVAGMRPHYQRDELLGKHVALVANLAPANLRGVESQGMIFGADDGATVSVLVPDKAVKVGAKIR